MRDMGCSWGLVVPSVCSPPWVPSFREASRLPSEKGERRCYLKGCVTKQKQNNHNLDFQERSRQGLARGRVQFDGSGSSLSCVCCSCFKKLFSVKGSLWTRHRNPAAGTSFFRVKSVKGLSTWKKNE